MGKITRTISSILKNIAKFLIRVYQKTLSLDHSFWGKRLGIRACIYHPSCSEYTYQAIDRFGLIRGSIMGAFRIARCTPFNKPGLDPVPEKFTVRRREVNEES
jgi:uncharacterized protein